MVNEAILDRPRDQSDDRRMSGASPEIEALAEAGDPRAQCDLAAALDAQGRHDQALAWLERAAGGGDTRAMVRLGVRLVTGEPAPAKLQAGVDFIATAAERGDGEACALMAGIVAAGRLRPQSWAVALDYLRRGAEWGDSSCQAQLALLTADTEVKAAIEGGDPPRDVWRWAHDGVDIEALLKTPPRRQLSREPRIRTFPGFLTQEVCDWMIEQARDGLAPARIYDDGSGGALKSERRSNTNAVFHPIQTDLIQEIIRARIGAVAGHPPPCLEHLSVLHYQVGQQFLRHVDFLDPTLPGLAAVIAQRGQRVATLLVYLNDDFDGAQTEFPVLALRWKGKAGDAILFFNVDAAGEPDRRTMHAGLAPTRGEKWLLSQFIREREQPFD
jgi:prolyl 4-hydroxylase